MNSGSCLAHNVHAKIVEIVLFANVWFKKSEIFHNGETRPAVGGLLVLKMGVVVRRDTRNVVNPNLGSRPIRPIISITVI